MPDWGPGLHWGAPLGIDRFDRVRTDEVRRLNVGAAQQAAADGDPGADEFLTGDLNLVRVRAVIQYRVASPAVLVVCAGDVGTLLALLAEARHSPELTAQRIYLDTMKTLLGRVRRKIVLPPGDSVDLTVLGIEE